MYSFLHKQKGNFKLPTLLKVAIDVSKGMSYLHQNKIIHRDLKTANLLMDEHGVSHCFYLKYNGETSLSTCILFLFFMKILSHFVYAW